MPYNLHTWGTVTGVAGSLITLADRLLTGISAAKNFDGGSTYVNNTAEARLDGGTPFILLLDSNDRFYWTFDVKAAGLRIDIATAATVMGALTFKYSKGGGTYGTVAVTDGTSGFTVDGNLSWTPPADWVTDTVDGVTGYQLYAECASGPTVAPTANFTVVNWVIFDGIAGTNAKVYFSPGENGAKTYYLYLEDNGAAAHTDAKSGAAILHETWDAGAHTGGPKCPTEAQVASGGWVRKSTTLDGTARVVIAGVDRDKAFPCIYSADTAGKAVPHYLGRAISNVGSDAYDGVVLAPTAADTGNLKNAVKWASWSVAAPGNYIQRRSDATGVAVAVAKAHPGGVSNVALPYPNAADGRLETEHFRLYTLSPQDFRGTLAPEFLAVMHTATILDADTYTDPDTGYIYRLVRMQDDGAGLAESSLFVALRNVP